MSVRAELDCLLDVYADRLLSARAEEGEAATDTSWLASQLRTSDRTAACAPLADGHKRRHWPQALEITANQGDWEMAQALERVGPAISWLEFPDDSGYAKQGAEFLENFAFAIIVGKRAMNPVCECQDYGFGVLLMGPDTVYPTHKHLAREVYYVVGGNAEWRHGGGDWVTKPPRTLIHHPACCPHATRTGSEPLLAFAAWVSDFRSTVSFVEDAG